VLSRVFPPAVGIGNLFLCAGFEGQLKNNPAGNAIATFFLLESFVYLVLAVGYYTRPTYEILDKCRIFPLTAPSRFWFVVISNIRRPMVLFFAGSAGFFLIILYRQEPIVLFVALGTLCLLFVALQFSISALCLMVSRTPFPAAVSLGFAFLCGFALVLASLFLQTGELPGVIPPVCWAVRAVRAAGAAHTAGIIGSCIALTVWGGGALTLGSRFA
jgi:hypothetical protein